MRASIFAFGVLLVVAPLAVSRSPLGAIIAGSRGASPQPELLWWQLNEGSGTTLADSSSGGGAAGSHDADYVSGLAATGLDFNGTSQDGATSSALTFGTAIITVTMWVNRDNAGSGNRILLESSANHNTNSNAWVVYVDLTNARFAASMQAGGQYRQEYCSLFTHSEWHHLAVVLDRNFNNGATRGKISLYIDGALQASTVLSNAITSTALLAPYQVFLAARSRSSIWFPGLIDDVRIYSGDRSADLAAIIADPR